MNRVSFVTFGCKLNQSETAGLVRDFQDHGYEVASNVNEADVVVINTCTVTARSDAKCRRAIRRISRLNPEATIIVAGCYAQVSWSDIATIKGVDYIVGSDDKFHIFDFFHGPEKLSEPKIVVSDLENVRNAVCKRGSFLNQTRAFLKIQDGCSNRCSYCIVPLTRGPNRSVPLENVIREAKALSDSGYREIVLTGVHIGDYGKDIEGRSLLVLLLKNLLKIRQIGRIRLSSLNVEDIDDDLLSVVSSTERICHHFHIPLQSGCDRILKAMNRKYSASDASRVIEKIARRFETIGLGTDIITGYPGETDSEFEQTYRFIKELPFSYLHVFPFSIRANTLAASAPDHVDPAVRTDRAERLRSLGKIKRMEFFKKHRTKEVDVLFENRNLGGYMKGLSSDYIRVKCRYMRKYINQIVKVKIVDVNSTEVVGRIVQTM